MEIVFTNPGVDYMICQIMEFQGENETVFWSDSLYHFFPQLDKAHAATLSFNEKKKYIDSVLRKVYAELEEMINEKTVLYSRHWETCKGQICDALSEAFELDCRTVFNDLRCNVSMKRK